MPAITNKPDAPQAPTPGEKTRAQGEVGVAGLDFSMGGFGTDKPGLPTYRRMNRNPTLALARFAATSLIHATDWSVNAEEAAPPGAKELIETCLLGVIRQLVKNKTRALTYGFAPSEIVWEARPVDGALRLVPRKIKPLTPDRTDVAVDKATGAFAGLRQGKVQLLPVESLVFTNDAEPGDFYGTSRHRAAMKAWRAWEDTLERTGKYTKRMAGGHPIVRYSPGESRDKTGAKVDNFELAKRILLMLEQGNGIVHPAEISAMAEDLIKAGVTAVDLFTWHIAFLEPKNRHGNDFDLLLRLYDAYMVRAWLIPERALLEGQHGTKAEAETHGGVAIAAQEDVLFELATTLNWHLVDKILALNFGDQARGTVILEPAPIVDDKLLMMQSVVDKLLGSPVGGETLRSLMDLGAILDQLGIPTIADPPAGPDDPGGDPDDPSTRLLMSIYGNLAKRLAA